MKLLNIYENKTPKKGISLLVLIITIIVVIILAGIIIYSLNKQNLRDSATKAKFMSSYKKMQEGITLYTSQRLIDSQGQASSVPTDDGALTIEDKENILEKVSTLATKILELNPDKSSLDEINLYWVDESKAGISGVKSGKENGYIVDADTNQLYDYKGEYFEGLRWHTLDGGLAEGTTPISSEQTWNGWITLKLYYPKGSTNRQWRLSEEGELRNDPMLMWQDYTTAIKIPLDRIKDVWIRYNLNNETQIIPPAGTLLVDIDPTPVYPTKTEEVKVTINYDKDAESKEYRIGNSGWMQYNGQFSVTQNCVIEAKASKTQNVYNTDGTLQSSSKISGYDKVQIKNIESVSLNRPSISQKDARTDDEVASVHIEYPTNAVKKVYTIDGGAEQNYTDDISITQFNTTVTAYYYTSVGEKSNEAELTVKGTLKTIQAPIISQQDARNDNELASVLVTYPDTATKKVIKINDGVEQDYSDILSITNWNTKVTAYYYTSTGKKSNEAILNVTSKLAAPKIEQQVKRNNIERASIKITYPDKAVKKVYTINNSEEQNYTDILSIKYWGTTVTAYYYDSTGTKSSVSEITINGEDKILYAPYLLQKVPTGSELARVQVEYPTNAVNKVYKVNDSTEQTYTGDILITSWNTKIEAYYYDKDTDESPHNNITVLQLPTLTRKDARNADEKASVHADYPTEANKKVYTINYGKEQIYTDDISVKEDGTIVTAYYYNSNGVRSQSVSITINPVNYRIPAPPTISINPTTQTSSVQVSIINVPAGATQTMLKIGRYGEYKEYSTPVTVTQNNEVYAYYRTIEGVKSEVAKEKITNIQTQITKPDGTHILPSVVINADPYPYKGAEKTDKITISVVSSNADTVEYSTDGVIYKTYTTAFDITQNGRIYARATNTYGTNSTYLDINNVGAMLEPPIQLDNIPVSINANPDPQSSSNKVTKVIVSIEYGSKAIEKYYSIGLFGKQIPYTGQIELTQNTTIYAYAKGKNAVGQASLKIDNLLDGISKPIILINPTVGKTASKVTVSINYDKNATVKKYSINGGALQDYTVPFEVSDNNSIIYAYNKNVKNQSADSSYTITNIVPEPPITLLDKGDYYIIHLNYPEISRIRQYKYKDGDWKTYNETGILLVKPQSKDKVIKGSTVKVIDDTGKTVDYTNDYYLLDVPISKLNEIISMRWDMKDPIVPVITASTTDPALQVVVSISYEDGSIQKQYKVVEPGTNYSDVKWQSYTSALTITKKGTVVYARSEDENEMWSKEAKYTVDNIDTEPPTITFTGDFTKPARKITLTITATDDTGVNGIRWEAGLKDANYFANNGTSITSGSTIDITENGTYSFYVDDTLGNYKIATLEITNIDNTIQDKPVITSSPTALTNQNVTVTIQYSDDAIQKQYSIDGTTWINYTTAFTVNKNLTVYARAIDEVGNDSGNSTLTIVNIDNEAPIITYSNIEIKPVKTTISVTDENLDNNSLKYVFDTQNVTYPTSGWKSFINNFTIIDEELAGEELYLWIEAKDKLGNDTIVKSEKFSTYIVYNYDKPGMYTLIIPSDGEYKLEVLGSCGEGQRSGGYNISGGSGGYSYGNKNFKKGDKIYIYVGGIGYNGGGGGSTYGRSGGGATDIRINGDSIEDRIIVAGGGGGASGCWGYIYNGPYYYSGNRGGGNISAKYSSGIGGRGNDYMSGGGGRRLLWWNWWYYGKKF